MPATIPGIIVWFTFVVLTLLVTPRLLVGAVSQLFTWYEQAIEVKKMSARQLA